MAGFFHSELDSNWSYVSPKDSEKAQQAWVDVHGAGSSQRTDRLLSNEKRAVHWMSVNGLGRCGLAGIEPSAANRVRYRFFQILTASVPHVVPPLAGGNRKLPMRASLTLQ
jgi:hypothetical protein